MKKDVKIPHTDTHEGRDIHLHLFEGCDHSKAEAFVEQFKEDPSELFEMGSGGYRIVQLHFDQRYYKVTCRDKWNFSIEPRG